MSDRRTNLTNGSARGIPGILLAALLLALPAPGHAEPPVPGSAQLRRAAHEQLDRTGDPVRVADYLVETALLLDDTDPGKAENLRLAGRLYHHAGRLESARIATLNAGVAAYRSGRDALAAHIFMDAAEVAAQTRVPGAARSAAERAGWVLRQGRLSGDERTAVLDRVAYRGNVEVLLDAVEVRG